MEITQAKALWETVFGKISLVEIIKWLRGEPARVQPHPETKGAFIVINGSGNSITINDTLARLIKEPDALRAADAMTTPLRRAGVERMVEVNGASQRALIQREEAGYFRRPSDAAELEARSVSTTTTVIVPRLLPTYSGPMWRVRQQGSDIDFFVRIEDQNFLSDWTNGRFDLRPGSGLRVVLETTTRTDPDGDPSAKYRVLAVLGRVDGIGGTQTTLLPTDGQ